MTTASLFPAGNNKIKFSVGNDIWECRPTDAQVYLRMGTGIKVMEVGVQEGRHARSMVELFKPSIFIGVDPWTDMNPAPGEVYYEKNFEEAQRYVGSEDNVSLIKGTSQSVMPTMEDDFFDYIYIDGDHHTGACIEDILNSIRLVRLGGVVGGHDYAVHSVSEAVQRIFNGHFVDSMDVDWWVMVTPEIKLLGRKKV